MNIYRSTPIVSETAGQVGWKPVWDKERFLEGIDGNIDAVIELGKAKSSLIDSLFAAVNSRQRG